MPYIIKEEKKKEIAIYVILFPSDNSFFVSKTTKGQLRNTYRSHYNYKKGDTEMLFIKARSKLLPTPMYVVQEVIATEKEAYRYCVAWVKYFTELGYTSVCNRNLDYYAEELRTEARQIYESIKDIPFNDVCPPGADLFPNFEVKKKKNENPDKEMISFRVKPNEYKKIKETADNLSLTLSEYCKKMALNSRVIYVDQDVFKLFSDCLTEFRERNLLLKRFLSAVYLTKKYHEADIKLIETSIEKNIELQNKCMSDMKNILNQLLDKQ